MSSKYVVKKYENVYLYTVTTSGYFRCYNGSVTVYHNIDFFGHLGRWYTGEGHYINKNRMVWARSLPVEEGKVKNGWLWLNQRDDDLAVFLMWMYCHDQIKQCNYAAIVEHRIRVLEKYFL